MSTHTPGPWEFCKLPHSDRNTIADLLAALHTIAEDGYDATTCEEIARAAIAKAEGKSIMTDDQNFERNFVHSTSTPYTGMTDDQARRADLGSRAIGMLSAFAKSGAWPTRDDAATVARIREMVAEWEATFDQEWSSRMSRDYLWLVHNKEP